MIYCILSIHCKLFINICTIMWFMWALHFILRCSLNTSKSFCKYFNSEISIRMKSLNNIHRVLEFVKLCKLNYATDNHKKIAHKSIKTVSSNHDCRSCVNCGWQEENYNIHGLMYKTVLINSSRCHSIHSLMYRIWLFIYWVKKKKFKTGEYITSMPC